MLNCKSVGVMGDGRTYEQVIALRAVETTDFMTADWFPIPYDVLARISTRIINEVSVGFLPAVWCLLLCTCCCVPAVCLQCACSVLAECLLCACCVLAVCLLCACVPAVCPLSTYCVLAVCLCACVCARCVPALCLLCTSSCGRGGAHVAIQLRLLHTITAPLFVFLLCRTTRGEPSARILACCEASGSSVTCSASVGFAAVLVFVPTSLCIFSVCFLCAPG